MSVTIDGLTYLLPPQAGLLRKLENRIAEALTGLGFNEIMLPLIVPSDSASAARKGGRVKFAAPDGEIMGLRDDMTAAAANLSVEELASSERPLKVFYSGPVFREPRNRGTAFLARQEMSIGAEVFGGNAFSLSLEAALASLNAIGPFKRDIQLRIGDISLLDGLLAEAGLTAEDVSALKRALLNKDVSYAARILEGLADDSAADAALSLIPADDAVNAIGKLKGILEVYRGTGLETKVKNSMTALEAASGLAGSNIGISFELGLIRPLDYYMGNLFEAYVEGYGSPILGGGQYDGLMKSLGSSESGSGFAVDLGMMLDLYSESAGGKA